MNKKIFLNLLGEMPTPCDPSIEIIEQQKCEGFIRQKISYEVEFGERISAYLCIPDAPVEGAAAVFCHHQHAGNHAFTDEMKHDAYAFLKRNMER